MGEERERKRKVEKEDDDKRRNQDKKKKKIASPDIGGTLSLLILNCVLLLNK